MLPPAHLAHLEIVVSRTTGQPEAVFDLASAQAAAVDNALTYYRRVRFTGPALDADAVIRMRALDGLSDQAHQGGDLGGGTVLRVSSGDARALAEAAALYVADRDVESYQSPEERKRIAVLTELSEPLRQVAGDLRAAEIGLGEHTGALS